MDLLTEKIIIFEENRTRAELYRLWLDDHDVEIALTKSAADEKLDGTVGIAVVERSFADGEAETLLGIIRARSPTCRVILTTDRSTSLPEVDHRLIKPVFREELTDIVHTFLYQANYHLSLRLYYKTTVALTEREMSHVEADGIDYEELRDRASELQRLIRQLRQEMNQDDLIDVRRAVVFENKKQISEPAKSRSSKYRPDSCARCGHSWEQSSTTGNEPAKRLAAYVWRCTNCGHTQMQTNANYQNVSWQDR